MQLIRVALAVPLYRFFDYLLPPELDAVIGGRVVVPLVGNSVLGLWWHCLWKQKLKRRN